MKMDNLFTRASRIQLLFRLWSLFYDNPVFQRPVYGRVHHRLLEKAKNLKADTILDTGCGTGELLLKLAGSRPEATIVGLDLSLEMLQVARKKDFGPASVHLIEQSVYSLPFKDESFDLITNTISSHWYTEFDRAFCEFKRVLKPGGMLLMASISNWGLYRIPGPWQNQLKTLHSTYLSPPHQRDAMETAGFQIISVQAISPWPTWLFEAQKPRIF